MALSFATRVVRWQREHGRTGLPWQSEREPYRVWLSEVMLQQTQAQTVIPYFGAFLKRFPSVQDLASAEADEVMALWSGLGYYSRARHLHAGAQAVVREHAGAFPRTAQELETLPSIGPSTAAAIASFCFDERVSIFDGNVQRLISRFLGFNGDLAQAQQLRELKTLAQSLVPSSKNAGHMPAYTQGLMDLGATVCMPRQAHCERCPMATDCRARASGEPLALPRKTKTLKRSSASWWLLWLHLPAASGLGERTALLRRPSKGIWSALHAPLVFEGETAWSAWSAEHPKLALLVSEQSATLHKLTHRDLHLHHVRVGAKNADQERKLNQLAEAAGARWFDREAACALGLPAPVRAWLEQPQPVLL